MMKNAVLAGAIIIHPVLFLIVFLHGNIFGGSPVQPGGAYIAFGWRGGLNAMGGLLALYLITLGIAPLILSVIGASLGGLVTWLRILHKKSRQSPSLHAE